jgi:hypothetical protein
MMSVDSFAYHSIRGRKLTSPSRLSRARPTRVIGRIPIKAFRPDFRTSISEQPRDGE